MQSQYCYILKTPLSSYTYNGYTIDTKRRIRQHNREIRGGAKATLNYSPSWIYSIILTSDDERFTKIKALSIEWHIHYPTNKRPRPKIYRGIKGRIDSLPLVFNNPKFSDIHFKLYVCEEDFEYTKNILNDVKNVTIYHMNCLFQISLDLPSVGLCEPDSSSESLQLPS